MWKEFLCNYGGYQTAVWSVTAITAAESFAGIVKKEPDHRFLYVDVIDKELGRKIQVKIKIEIQVLYKTESVKVIPDPEQETEDTVKQP